MRWVRPLPDSLPENPPAPPRETAGGSLARLLASGELGRRLIAAAHAGAAPERAAIALAAADRAPYEGGTP